MVKRIPLALVLVLTAHLAVAAEAPTLFTTSSRLPDSVRTTPPDPTVVRTTYVTAAVERITANERITLNLFPDAHLVARRIKQETRRDGHYTWFGDLQSHPGHAILVVNEGRIAGNVRVADQLYRIRYAGDGIHTIQQVDLYAFPPEDEPLPVPDEVPKSENRELGSPGSRQDSLEGRAPDASMMTDPDDGSIIDVLIVYTDDVGQAVADIEGLVQLAIAETNQGYANSDVAQRLRLVDFLMVDYEEIEGSHSSSIHLGRLRDPDDDHIDIVHDWRDDCAADVVSFWLESIGGNCGRAFTMTNVSPGFEDYAFSVVARGCATGYFSFGHELGHNMGAKHDCDNSPEDGAYEYSHGYQEPAGPFRTVMAYACDEPEWCEPRIDHYSNPDVYYGGPGVDCSGNSPPPPCLPTGTPYNGDCAADNAQTFDNTAYTVANFRLSGDGTCVLCTTSAECDDEIFCNGAETCEDGQCVDGPDPCVDEDHCNEAAEQCLDCIDAGECGDGLFCNGVEECIGGICVDGPDPCIDLQHCDEAGGECLPCIDPSECDDQVFCNGTELCENGQCLDGPDPCIDPEHCSESTAECLDCIAAGECSDGQFCNGEEACTDGTCVDGPDPCVDPEHCDETANECLPCIDPSECDDQVFCNGAELCENGQCVGSPDPCVDEAHCDEVEDVCLECLSSKECDDGLYCNGRETCESGVCIAGDPPCATNEGCNEAGRYCAPTCPSAHGCGGGNCRRSFPFECNTYNTGQKVCWQGGDDFFQCRRGTIHVRNCECESVPPGYLCVKHDQSWFCR